MPKIEFTEQEKKEQKAKVEKTKKKSGRPFKVRGHAAQYEILQNSIFKHLLGDDSSLLSERYRFGPKTDWIVEDFTSLLDQDMTRFVKHGTYFRFNKTEILNEIKILANEGKVELGKHKNVEKRTIKLAPGFVWCKGCNEYEWYELLALRGC